MFYCEYEPIEEENESKLSSEGEIRTDVSNTDDSFNIDLDAYVDICEEPSNDHRRASIGSSRMEARGRSQDALARVSSGRGSFTNKRANDAIASAVKNDQNDEKTFADEDESDYEVVTRPRNSGLDPSSEPN